jgi:hypothetical protein
MDIRKSTKNKPFYFFQEVYIKNKYNAMLSSFFEHDEEFLNYYNPKFNKKKRTYTYTEIDNETGDDYVVKKSFDDSFAEKCREEYFVSEEWLQERLGECQNNLEFLNQQKKILTEIEGKINSYFSGIKIHPKVIASLIKLVDKNVLAVTRNTNISVNKPKKAPPVPINKIKYKKLEKINQFVSAIKEKPGLFDSVNKQNLINVFSGAAPASKIKWELKSKGNGSVTLIYFLFSLIKHELIDKLDSGELSDSIVLCFKDSNGNDFLKRRLEEPKIAAQAHLDGERKSKSKEINKINELLEKLEKIKKLH